MSDDMKDETETRAKPKPDFVRRPLKGMSESEEVEHHLKRRGEAAAYIEAIESGTVPNRVNVQSLRLSDAEADLLREAAEATGTKVSAFIRDAALVAARAALSADPEVVWTVDHEAMRELALTLEGALNAVQDAAEPESHPGSAHRLLRRALRARESA
ncbi:plasmid mobilization protein [Actinomadura fibrosa]|uniref:DUF1778 domain-containing protein n=1 Tax=Actinomadura fibrosa TaxID=111802 RepID=A0ABW2Y0E4_9ACTN|nr:DUF1778 domain-containing protein [Actinomadura fibrosa]